MTGLERHPWQARTKVVLDPVLAALLFVVLSPLLLAIALAILVSSGRPVLFVRPRAGRNGKPFRMLKFRSMVPDALEVGRRLELTDDPFGLVQDDPRFTRGGRFLRRTGLDELPQLINVIRLDMSLVGPRPDLVEQAEHYTPDEARRLLVRPGITGWSQVHGREDMTWPERFRLDHWYLDHWNLWIDAGILVRTIGQLFRAHPVPVVDAHNIERAKAKGAAGGARGVTALREVEPEAWDPLLERLGLADAYLLRGYLESAAVLDPGRAVLLHLAGDRGDVVFACLVRDVPGVDGRVDVTTPYGYGGPVAAGEDPPADGFAEGYEAWAAEAGALTTFVRFHPLFGNQRLAPRRRRARAPRRHRHLAARRRARPLRRDAREAPQRRAQVRAGRRRGDGRGRRFARRVRDALRGDDARPRCGGLLLLPARVLGGAHRRARRAAAAPRRPDRGRADRVDALHCHRAVAPLPPGRDGRHRPEARREQAAPARGGALGPGPRAGGAPSRERARRERGFALEVQAALLRPSGPGVLDRQARARRGGVPRARRHRLDGRVLPGLPGAEPVESTG